MLDLAKELPIYLVPADLIPIEELPLDDNGRLDRAHLPEPGVAEGLAPSLAASCVRRVAAVLRFCTVDGGDAGGRPSRNHRPPSTVQNPRRSSSLLRIDRTSARRRSSDVGTDHADEQGVDRSAARHRRSDVVRIPGPFPRDPSATTAVTATSAIIGPSTRARPSVPGARPRTRRPRPLRSVVAGPRRDACSAATPHEAATFSSSTRRTEVRSRPSLEVVATTRAVKKSAKSRSTATSIRTESLWSSVAPDNAGGRCVPLCCTRCCCEGGGRVSSPAAHAFGGQPPSPRFRPIQGPLDRPWMTCPHPIHPLHRVSRGGRYTVRRNWVKIAQRCSRQPFPRAMTVQLGSAAG